MNPPCQGTVAAVQTLSEINVMQVQQMQKLQDLLAKQNVASSAFMAAQNSKGDAVLKNNRSIMGDGNKAMPSLSDYK